LSARSIAVRAVSNILPVERPEFPFLVYRLSFDIFGARASAMSNDKPEMNNGKSIPINFRLTADISGTDKVIYLR
jgi:hypothetical protein